MRAGRWWSISECVFVEVGVYREVEGDGGRGDTACVLRTRRPPHYVIVILCRALVLASPLARMS